MVCKKMEPKKEYIQVEQPKLINNYNQHMGGTDQMDQQIACYNPSMKNRKWYFPIFIFLLKTSCYNAWILMKQLKQSETELSYLGYLYTILNQVCCTVGRKMNTLYGKSAVAKRVPDNVRFDGMHHYMAKMDKKSRCGLCKKLFKHTVLSVTLSYIYSYRMFRSISWVNNFDIVLAKITIIL